jgi:hypothetical protein
MHRIHKSLRHPADEGVDRLLLKEAKHVRNRQWPFFVIGGRLSSTKSVWTSASSKNVPAREKRSTASFGASSMSLK